jgi:putative mRNA 3-end processing factor
LKFPIGVAPSGTVLLGRQISCDGFHYLAKARVQTHVHDDHMSEFESSKGFQDILLSEPTKDLLIQEFNADLLYRTNIRSVTIGLPLSYEGNEVQLLRSGHMLGAVQVGVTLPDGVRVGYSGDFQWPLQEVIKVDGLVLDSTYGSPANSREYSQADAETAFLELMHRRLLRGPVHVLAHRGTLQRALQLLCGQVGWPIVVSHKLLGEVDVYRRHGYTIEPLLCLDTPDGQRAIAESKFIRIYGRGDGRPVDLSESSTVTLSAYMSRPDTPVLAYSDRAYSVAISNHADFRGTLDYVVATGAQFVLTDNTRGKGVELAYAIQEELGIEAEPSSSEQFSREWGD